MILNLQGSVFHESYTMFTAKKCGKMISVMPYVINMPISKAIAEKYD